MKKLFAFTVLMTLTLGGFAQFDEINYDFAETTDSGQTLYYRILTEGYNEVAVTYPDYYFGWSNYDQPEGDLFIPELVEYQGINYSVTSIDDEAFSSCQNITSVVLPNSVTSIGDRAFKDMGSKLTNFFLPNSVTKMGDFVFENDDYIEYDIYNDKIFAYHPTLSTLPYDIPDGIEEIAGGAFAYCSTTGVSIPNSVKKIGVGAFRYSNLRSAIIPDGVTCIKNSTFYGAHLRSITIPNSVTTIEQNAFWGCTSLDSIILPDELQSIGSYAFLGCPFLSINIPNSVTSIGDGAFSDCKSLTSFELPNSVTDMGAYVFSGCDGLSYPVYNNRFFAYYPCDYASSYNIPEGVEIILEGSFTDCTKIDSISFPNSVKTIKKLALDNCDSLTYVLLPESLETIEDLAFRGCSRLATINLPNSLTYIGMEVFTDCQNLQEPLFNNRYFAHFPKNYATTYSIPDGIEEILEHAFVSCDSLLSVTLPNSVTKIRYRAISGCENLMEINILAEVPPTTDTVFNEPFYPWSVKPIDAFIFVPIGTLETYLNSGWIGYFWCMAEKGSFLPGREMYYEIMNDNSSITYQHLLFAADTVINDERPTIIVRSNTHYDRDEITTEVTHEYVFERDGKVYWWNKETEEFTILYDFWAQIGDEWVIKVGTETVTVHVDTIEENYTNNSLSYKILRVRDTNNIFSGTIIRGVGHTTSFFPEKLMSQDKNFRVEGMRCYWKNGVLVFKNGEVDCDEIYEQYHYDVEEKETEAFRIYPNPAEGILTVETQNFESLPYQTYRITNLMGQTVMLGKLNADNQQIDITKLPSGMYFVSVGEQNHKIIKK